MRVYVDFNSRDDEGNIIINLDGQPDDVRASVVEASFVTLYDEELEVEALLQKSKQFDQWLVGVPNWSTRRFIKHGTQ